MITEDDLDDMYYQFYTKYLDGDDISMEGKRESANKLILYTLLYFEDNIEEFDSLAKDCLQGAIAGYYNNRYWIFLSELIQIFDDRENYNMKYIESRPYMNYSIQDFYNMLRSMT